LINSISPHKLARNLALCLDYRTIASGSSSLGESANSQIVRAPPGLQETSTIGHAQQYVIDRSRVKPTEGRLPQNVTSLDLGHEESEISKGLRDMPLSGLSPLRHAARTKVLLVEDNIVNMKVCDNCLNFCGGYS